MNKEFEQDPTAPVKAKITTPQKIYADNACAVRDDLFEPMLSAQSAGQKKTLIRSQFFRKRIDEIFEHWKVAQRRAFAREVDSILASYDDDFGPLHAYRLRREHQAVCDKMAAAARKIASVGLPRGAQQWDMLESVLFANLRRAGNGDPQATRRARDSTASAIASRQVATFKVAITEITDATALIAACKAISRQSAGPSDPADILISNLARAVSSVSGVKPSRAPDGDFAQFVECVLEKSVGSDRLGRLISGLNLTGKPPRP